MTICCVYVHDKGVTFGSDTARQYGCLSLPVQKWTVVGKRAVATSGIGRAGTIVSNYIQHILNDNDGAPYTIWRNFLGAFLSEGLKLHFKDGDTVGTTGADMLYICAGQAWFIGEDGTITPVEKFWAIGTGSEIALGVYWALSRSNSLIDPELLVRSCIEAAIELVSSCGGTPYVHTLG